MKNTAEKAKEIVDKMVKEDGLDVPAMMQRKLEERIKIALKEQDRDTRHACAEAVIQCDDMNDMCADSNEKWIDIDDAHKACINVNIT